MLKKKEDKIHNRKKGKKEKNEGKRRQSYIF